MGELVHPLFSGAELSTPDPMPSIESEIQTLIDALIEYMGMDGYCKWLATNTPVAWVLDAPYAEIADGLRSKLDAGLESG